MISHWFYNFSKEILDCLNNNFTLQEALENMSAHKTGGKKLKSFSNYILSELEKGSSLANIFLANPYIILPLKYRQLLASEEKTGDYKKSLTYICNNEREKKESILEYLKISIYPLFIIILCFTGSLFFGYYSKNLAYPEIEISIFKGLMFANIFLFFFLLFFSLVLYLTHRKSEKTIFFICLDFFLRNTYDLTTALENTGLIFKENSKMKYALTKTINDLELGIPISQAFSESLLFTKDEIKKIEVHLRVGKLVDGIRVILEDLDKKAKNLKQVFASLIEPFLIFGAGAYLLIIIMQSILPFFLFYGGLL